MGWLGACAPMPVAAPPPPFANIPTFQRAAYAGTRQRLDFLTTLRPDCSYMGPSNYHFLMRPQHGLVEFKSAQEPPAFLQSSIFYKCNDHRVGGVMMYFTPDRSFSGNDRFVIEWISPAGLLYSRKYEVAVK